MLFFLCGAEQGDLRAVPFSAGFTFTQNGSLFSHAGIFQIKKE